MTIFIGSLLAWFNWPLPLGAASPGLDGSWHIALHHATQLGMDFGTEIVFTYGPLGFLMVPSPYLGVTTALALVVGAVVHVSASVLFVHLSRKQFRLIAAIVAAALAGRVLDWLELAETLVVLAFLFSVVLIQRQWTGRGEAALAAGAGTTAGVLLLTKLNAGVVVTLLLGITVFALSGRPPWQRLAIFVATLLVSLSAAWLLAGQPLGALLAWVALSYEITLGYSSAMGVQDPSREWQLFAVPVVASVLGVASFDRSRAWPRRNRVALAALMFVIGFASWKTGFVRWHSQFFFATAFLMSYAFLSAEHWRTTILTGAALLLAFLASVHSTAGTLVDPLFLDPLSRPETALKSVGLLWSPDARAGAVATNRQLLQDAYAIDDQMLSVAAGHTVHIDPWSAGVAWAYPEVSWAPTPVFQSYSAYTPPLDRANARFLSGVDGPQFVLRQAGQSIDLRNQWWESPEARLAIVCNYAEHSATAYWQLLERTSDRCGAETVLSSVSVFAGTVVELPAPSPRDITIIRIHGLGGNPVDRAWTSLYKGREWFLEINSATRFRLVPATANGPLIVSLPEAVGGTAPFDIGVPIHRIELIPDDGTSIGPGTRIEIGLIPVDVDLEGDRD